MAAHVFAPLHMEHSSAAPEENRGRIQGHRNYFGIPIPAEPLFPTADSWIQPAAGYIGASASDMGRYLQMYLQGGGDILAQESVDAMFYENVYVDASIPYWYGMGWTLIREPLPEPALRHSGLVETGMACMYILPERGVGAILLADTNDYLVGKDMMDRMDWGMALLLMGERPNEIGAGEYWTAHLLYDAAYLLVLAAALLPLLRLRQYKAWAGGKRGAWRILSLAGLHVALPTALLVFPRVLLGTPLWVVRDFVPDLFLVLMCSAILLYAGGVCKFLWLLHSRSGRDRLHNAQ